MSDGRSDRKSGVACVVSAPSGAGKTSLCASLLARDANTSLSISMTTREQREREETNKDYYFVSRDRFIAARDAGELLEWAEVFGNLYGTPRADMDAKLRAGRDVIFDVDWQGAASLRQALPDFVVSIFVLPPSMEKLENRLRDRRRDPEDVIQSRMAEAHRQIQHFCEFDFVVINDDLDRVTTEVQEILRVERKRLSKQLDLPDFVERLLQDKKYAPAV